MSLFYETIGGEMKPINAAVINPMVRDHGEHFIRDMKCKTCKRLLAQKPKGHRCSLNPKPADHKSTWQACAKYQHNK